MTDEQQSGVREAYLEQMVESAGRDGLLIMLVEGAVNFIRRAGFALEKEKLEEVHICLVKAQNIYLELVVTIDLDAGEFAESIASVYQYLYNLLIEANLDKDAEKIGIALKLAEDIRDLWKETVEKAHEEARIAPDNQQATEPPAAIKPQVETGVYEPVGGARLDKSKPPPEDSQSSLNITG